MATSGWLLAVLVWAWPLLCRWNWFWEESNLSPWVLKRTLSHTWLKLYLPMFLFYVGLFTLMETASLMVLARPWSSISMMLKLLVVGMCPVCWMCMCMGEGCLRCSLYLSPRVFDVSPMFSFLQAMPPHWKLYITPLFWSLGSLSLDFMRSCLLCFPWSKFVFHIYHISSWNFLIFLWCMGLPKILC